MTGLSNSCPSFSLCIASSVADSVQVTLLAVNFQQPETEREGKKDCENWKNEGFALWT